MRKYRQTIKSNLQFTGKGVHCAIVSKMTICPAPANSGIVFYREDLTKKPIKAIYSNVVNTSLATVIESYGESVSTIEHIMSALFACEIDDVHIFIDGPEVPILDGSAKDFTQLILACSTTSHSTPLKYLKVLRKVEIDHKGRKISIMPNPTFELEANIDFNHPKIGVQKIKTDMTDYLENIAPARTFAFESDVENMQKNGLALGGSLSNAVVFNEKSSLNELRFKDECVRHKMLDLIGDLSTAAIPIIGKVIGYKMGHQLNNQLLKALFAQKNAYMIE